MSHLTSERDNVDKESDGYQRVCSERQPGKRVRRLSQHGHVCQRESVVKDNAVIIVRLLSEYSHACQREYVVADNPVIKVTDCYRRVYQMSCRQSKFPQKVKQFTNI